MDYSNTNTSFYCEVGPSQAIRDSYAPPGNCRHCNTKLSRYRSSDKTKSGYEEFCSLCIRKDYHLLPQSESKNCEACGEEFTAYADRIYCSLCIIPSVRQQRMKYETINNR